MIALLQRVQRAEVRVAGAVASRIGAGLLVLLGIEKEDTEDAAKRLAHKTARYRIFPDESGDRPMHRSVLDVGGGVLIVSQFTLCADTRKGLRPGFDPAAAPEHAEALYEFYCERLVDEGVRELGQGRFQSHMEVELVNDGPVTIWLSS